MKKKLTILCLLIMITVCSIFGIGMISGFAETPNFASVQLQSLYELNSMFSVPQIKVEYLNEEYSAKAKVVFPSGACYLSESFVLTEEGVYTIIYYCEIDGKYYQNEKTFEVKNSSNGLFSVKNGSVKFGESDISEDLFGAQFDGVLGMSVEYNQIIDLSDSTRDDLLLEILATAHTPQIADFSEFFIKLTDVYDEENTITIKVHCCKTDSYSLSYAKAKASCNPDWVGVHNGKPQKLSYIGGTVLRHSFGSWEFKEQNSIRLYWDNQDLSLYSINNNGALTEICDFNDEAYISKIWGGFTTGEVKLSIEIGDVSGMPRYVIKSIDGTEFVSQYPTDTRAPAIYVDEPENEKPNALVGKPFKVFPVTAKDNLFIDELTTKVYYNYANGNYVEYSIINGKFIPDRAGEYTIVYTVKDGANNKVEKRVAIMAYESLPTFNVEFLGQDVETHAVGDLFPIQDYLVEGGSGVYDVKLYLKENGTETEIKEEDLRLLEQGQYEIILRATDYIENSWEDLYSITIIEQRTLSMQAEFHLPKAFISGQSFVLPLPVSYDYLSGTAIAVKPVVTAMVGSSTITVGADGTITPVIMDTAESVVLKYSYQSGELFDEYTFEVPIVKVQDADGLAMEKYFLMDGFSTNALVDSICFSTSVSNATASFIKPLQAKSFTFDFSVDETLLNVSYIDFEFTDRLNKDISVFVRLYTNGTMSVNGGETKTVTSSANGTKQLYSINYDNQTFKFSDRGGVPFGIVDKTKNGKTFEGFTSDEIYLTVRTGTVNKSTNIYFLKLNGQVISRAARDVNAPQVFLDEELGGVRNVGDKVIIYPAKAYDVLSDIKSFLISVRNTTTGEVAKSIEGIALNNVDAARAYEMQITSFGTYMIEVVAKDANNRAVTMSKTMYVGDTIKPIITIKGSVPVSVKVNSNVSLPSMQVTDNMSAENKIVSYIVVFDANGYGMVCNGSFVPKMIGTYTIRYVAMDEYGNSAVKESKIVVTA